MINRFFLCANILFLLSICATLTAQTTNFPAKHLSVSLDGSFSGIEGISAGRLGLQTAYHIKVEDAVFTPGFLIDFSFQRHAATVDFVGEASLAKYTGRTKLRPFAGLGWGVRQTFLGSFKELRYIVQGSIGARYFVTEDVSFNLNFRRRMLLNDPVADFTENDLRIGISVFF